MVATRHSLPSTATESETSPPKDKKVNSALKKLQIDGTKALLGEKPAHGEENLQVYHFRGAAYAVTDNTKKEWVEKQPQRWKKRISGVETTEDEREEDEERFEQEEAPRMKGKKRAFSLDGAGDSYDEEQAPTKKRTRRSAPEAPSRVNKKRALSLHEADDEELPTPKRARRNVPEKFYGRPKRTRTSSTNNTRKKRRSKPAEDEDDELSTSRTYDYAIVGGQEQQSCIEARRELAAAKGYAVKPLPQQDANALARSLVGRKIAKDLVQLARINSQVEKLSQQYEESKQQLADHREHLEREEQRRVRLASIQPTLAGSEEPEDPREVRQASIQPTLAASEPPPSSGTDSSTSGTPRAPTDSPTAEPKRTSTQKTVPPSDASKPSEEERKRIRQASIEVQVDFTDSTTSQPSEEEQRRIRQASIEVIPPRHDSAASISPPTTTKAASPSANTSIFDLPDTIGGTRVRWSLSKVQTCEDRAEAQINTSRLEGESNSARRRRVKREFKVLNQWEQSPA